MNRARRLFQLFGVTRDPTRAIDDELELHVALRTEEFEQQGQSPTEARAAALRSFGDRESTRQALVTAARRHQQTRRGVQWIDTVRGDLRQAVRSMRRAPQLALGAMVAFALGIGATTTMFSIGHAILSDLPVSRPERLLQLVGVDRLRADDAGGLRLTEFIELRERQRTMEGVAILAHAGFHLGDGKTAAERVPGNLISAGTFAVAGEPVALGREFGLADELPGAPPVIVLSDRLWRDRFRADPAVIGTVVRVNGLPTTVVGVMPVEFEFPSSAKAWMPITLDRVVAATDTAPQYQAVGRLRDGASLEGVRAEVGRIGSELVRARNGRLERESLSARPFADFMISAAGRLRVRAMILVVSSVLVIACANVANLLLARAAARSREIAIRLGLGSSRWALVRGLLVEVLVLAAVGGLIGAGLAGVGVAAFAKAVAFELPFWTRFELDWSVLAFVAFLIVGSALLSGVGAGWKASRVGPADVLRGAHGPSGIRLGRVSRELLTVQVALATTLLVISGLMVKGAVDVLTNRPLPAPEEIGTARIELDARRYPTEVEQDRVVTEILDRLRELPNVTAAVAGTATPGFAGPSIPFALPGQALEDGPHPTARVSAISPGFFAGYRIAPTEGREFAPDDRSGAPRVAVVTRTFAARYLGGRSPIGATLRIAGPAQPFDPNRVAPQWVHVVGVVEDLDFLDRDTGARGTVFLPLSQVGDARLAIGIRARGDPLEAIAALRRIVLAVDQDLPVFQGDRLVGLYARDTAAERIFTSLFAGFGLSGLVLASVGLFALVAFGVRQRYRETGIRLALGESGGSVVWRLARGGLGRVVVGLVVGLGLASLASPALRPLFVSVSPRDPAIYGGIAVVIAVVALAAVLAPTRRALRGSPLEALRAD